MGDMGQGTLVIRGGQVIDCTGRDPIPNGSVVLEDGHIAAVGPSQDVRAPRSADIFDADGMSVLPGLIDAHVHITMTGGADLVSMVTSRSFGRVAYDTVAHLRDTVRAGVTSIRTMGDVGFLDIAARDAIRRGQFIGPRIVACGKGLTSTGGHAVLMPPWIKTEYGDSWEIVNDTGGARAAVRRQVEAGADHIKVFQTGGVIDPGGRIDAEEFTVEELSAIVETARACKRPVACHAHNKAGILHAIEAGVRSIEHGMYFDDECAARAKARDVFFVPTLIVMDNILRLGPQHGVPEFYLQNISSRTPQHHGNVRSAFEAGVRIVTGTDAGSVLTGHGAPGYEVAMLVKAGLPPMAALLAATANAAALLGIDREVGTLEAGKCADVIVVRGDALADPTVVAGPDRMAAVFVGGASLGQAQAAA
ncbi:MAG: amidohydrolase family protein [Bacillati bacterium ANGP1]|uniref:Amidohydrolase family protein n=1 Tax=Candidatus Segetimicrobium genomatis TaxID=2569760 RepID=A0A537JTX0_9BACT|nr:MAG: amidohydrolase family protein [Terrabacteria group bacterium ANGP1]